jgi:uncharacterized protein (DUF1499 family)
VLLPILIAVGLWIVLQFLGRNPPPDLGIHDAALADCPETPNCACSDCEGPNKMEPLPFEGEASRAKSALKAALARKGIKVLKEEENYLHAVATTPILRFRDDLEFLIDSDSRLIHFRSASRLGKSDLGKNRARMNEIAAEFSAALRKSQ